jgi:hypothetical protein
LILYFLLVTPKLDYASVVWNSITSTDAKKLERIQRKFVALCYNRFRSRDSNGYSYAYALQVLNLHTLHDRRHQLDASFVTDFFWALNLFHLPWTLLVYEYPLGTSETVLCFMLVHPIKIVPPAGAQLPQIRFVINWMSSEGKLSHLVRRDILLHYFKVSLLIVFYLFVLVVFVLLVSCSVSVVICVCMLCCLCNWPFGC